MDNAIAIGAIIGLINAVQRQFPQVAGLIAIGVSVIVGVVLGYFNYLGVSGVENGVLVGLSASGVYTVAKKVGGN